VDQLTPDPRPYICPANPGSRRRSPAVDWNGFRSPKKSGISSNECRHQAGTAIRGGGPGTLGVYFKGVEYRTHYPEMGVQLPLPPCFPRCLCGGCIAQLVEQRSFKSLVQGSSPCTPTHPAGWATEPRPQTPSSSWSGPCIFNAQTPVQIR
jgi:hypothetical protein